MVLKEVPFASEREKPHKNAHDHLPLKTTNTFMRGIELRRAKEAKQEFMDFLSFKDAFSKTVKKIRFLNLRHQGFKPVFKEGNRRFSGARR